MDKPKNLEMIVQTPDDVKILDGFITLTEDELKEMHSEMGLAMSIEDLIFCRSYFRDMETGILKELCNTENKIIRCLRNGDAIAHSATLLFGFGILVLTALLVLELFTSSAATRGKFGWSFLSGTVWDPVSGEFGALPFVYGTVVTSVVALIISVPLSLGAAIFLAELARPGVSDALAFLIEILAAVPSVIYGLLGVFILVPFMRDVGEPVLRNTLGFLPTFHGPAYGVGLLTAAAVLAIMMVPFIVAVSREALLAVPRNNAKARSRWAQPGGSAPGRSCFHTRAPESSARFFWAWPAHSEKPWRSRW
jgi:hypothetical protein